MKKTGLAFCLLFLAAISSFSQYLFPRDENGNISYTGIEKIDSVKANELYVRAHTWFANSFNSAKDVIQLNDKEAGKMIGKGFFIAGIEKGSAGVVKTPLYFSVHFTIDIQTKDGRYKYNFTDFSCYRFENTANEINCNLLSTRYIKNGAWQKALDHDWLEVKKDVNFKMQNFVESLKKAMKEPGEKW